MRLNGALMGNFNLVEEVQEGSAEVTWGGRGITGCLRKQFSTDLGEEVTWLNQL
jgi:hypothetical protein